MNINLTLVGQLIMFAMFTWFCMKFVWPPIVIAMEERRKRIEEGLLAAEKGMHEKEEAHKKSKEIIKESKEKAAHIITNAKSQAASIVEDSKELASIEAEKIKNRTTAELEQDTIKAKNELKNQISDLVMKGVSVILEKEVDSKNHKEILNKLTQSL
jgi:F-type H+-transporting ATPase subunit b